MKIPPGTGRWQSEGLTEGSQLSADSVSSQPWDPSTASRSPSPFRGGFILEQSQ